MLGLMRAYRGLADSAGALEWTDRLLPIAERLGDLQGIARGLQGRGMSLALTGRSREGIILLRGAHDLALANDLDDVELSSRVLLTFYEQWGEPAAGLALGREGLEIGERRGSRAYGLGMIGNSVISALRVGQWDWAASVLDEWLAIAGNVIAGQRAFRFGQHVDFVSQNRGHPVSPTPDPSPGTRAVTPSA